MNLKSVELPDRERLAWLRDHQQALTELMDAAGARRGWWRANLIWSRQFARFDPLSSPYCTLLFESECDAQHLCLVEAHGQSIELHSEHEIGLPCAPLGWLKLSRFPHDPALATLPDVLKETAHAKVARYRPHMRCTLRVATESGEVSFAKVFSAAYGAAIHDTGVLLWNASSRGELGFHVARPLRWDADRLCLWQSQVPGAPVQPQLLGEHGPEVAYGLGQSLATLSKSSLPVHEEFSPEWQFERTAAYVRDLAARLPRAASALDALLADFDRIHAQLGPATPVPLHGAPHPHQWLAGPQGYALVDFDRCGRGDAELDVATFVAEVDFENPKRFDVARINEEFVRGFESVAGPLDPRRFGLYRAHKHVAKALRLARGMQVDGLDKASALIDHVRVNFTSMCASASSRTWVLANDWKRRVSVLGILTITKIEGFIVSVCECVECVL
jgi:Phosphotransferase enzyme family